MPLVSDAKLGPYEIVGPLGAGGMDGVYRALGLPVVTNTRVRTGRVFPLSAARGSALALKKIGCVLADDLSPQKARILLMLALTKTRDPATLQNYF